MYFRFKLLVVFICGGDHVPMLCFLDQINYFLIYLRVESIYYYYLLLLKHFKKTVLYVVIKYVTH